jgi:hypothetical protein
MAEGLFTEEELAATLPAAVEPGVQFGFMFDAAFPSDEQQSVWVVSFVWDGFGEVHFTLDLEHERQSVILPGPPIRGWAVWYTDLLAAHDDPDGNTLGAVIVPGGGLSDEADLADPEVWVGFARTLHRAIIMPEEEWPHIWAG